MIRYAKRYVLACMSLLIMKPGLVFGQNHPPVVSSVTAAQRTDASKLVDIHYDLADVDGDPCTVWVTVSDNGGTSFRVFARSFTGHVGPSVAPGTNKAVVWDAGADLPGKTGMNFKVRVFADDGKGASPMVLVPEGWLPYQNVADPSQWVFIDTFQIDTFEVTNAAYVEFLNNADPTALHWDAAQEINRLGDAGNYTYLPRAGKENHPVRYVNVADAEAYAAWRGAQTGQTFRLPTQFEWEKAAAWDPITQHYSLYGFHSDTIACADCNYHPSAYCVGDTQPVGTHNGTNSTTDAKSYYGCYDLAGNVAEWTSEVSGANRITRGGSWSSNTAACFNTTRTTASPFTRSSTIGFRLVRVTVP